MSASTPFVDELESRLLFAHPTFSVVRFDDPNGTYAAYYNDISRAVAAAGNDWGQYFDSASHLDVEVVFTTDMTIQARCGSSGIDVVGTDPANGKTIYGAGVAAKIAKGLDVNGSDPDATLTISDYFLRNEWWFDPDPTTRTTPVAAYMTDAYSVILHELGHALGISGYINSKDGQSPFPYYETSWDRNNTSDGTVLRWTGATADNWYGQRVPLQITTFSHVGNAFPDPGYDLTSDLMTGTRLGTAQRYYISGLDLALLQDTGLNVTLQPWATVAGQVFLDANGNGVANRGDGAAAGWKVYVDVNKNGLSDANEPTAVTDSKGRYTISGMKPGTYTVRTFGRKGYRVSTPAAASAMIKAKLNRVTAIPTFGETKAPAPKASVAHAATPAAVFSRAPIADAASAANMAIELDAVVLGDARKGVFS